MTEQATPTRLFNRNILLLIQGQAVSLFGSQAFYIAITFWIKQVSNSPALMGTYLMVTGLPAILLGPVAGTVADRYGRRSILVICDLICALTMIALAAFLLSSGRTGNDTLVWVFAASIVISVCGCFFQPAINSMIPDLVPINSLMQANSVLGAISKLVIFAGKALGGILLRLLGAPLMFLLDGLSYLFSAITELFVRVPPRPPTPAHSSGQQAGFWSEMRLGCTYVWADIGLRAFFALTGLLNFFITPYLVLMPFYVEDVLQLRVDWYGYLLSGLGLGSLLGAVLAGVTSPSAQRRGPLLMALIPLAALGFFGLGLFPSGGAAVCLLFVAGTCCAYYNTMVFTLLQLSTPETLRGRVLGLLGTVSAAMMPLGMGVSGWLAEWFNSDVVEVFNLAGGLLLLCSLLILCNPAYRRFLVLDTRM